jgi:hypothetical protein
VIRWLALALTWTVAGCTVDTELGVAAEIQSAAVSVSGTGDTSVVSASVPTRSAWASTRRAGACSCCSAPS